MSEVTAETVERLFTKMDKMQTDISDIKVCVAGLPCKEHKEKFRSLAKAIAGLWALQLLIIAGIFGLAWKSLS